MFRWKDGQSHTLDVRNNLPCSTIYSAIKDNAGAFWLYSQCGLVKITGADMAHWLEQPASKVNNIDIFDGLDGAQPGTSLAQPKASKAPDGRLWFVNGIFAQMIDPDCLYENSTPPPIHIEEVIADHKGYSPQADLRLPALTRDLEIDYTALSFTVPRRVNFRYKLEGHDSGWQDPGIRRQAFYSNLHPGAYRFRVIASNNSGVWNDTGAMLNFSIAPAWYQTHWFILACILTGILIVWLLYQLRVAQIESAISARFDERLDERTRLARDLHDTLLQTIQGSKMVADDALDKTDNVTHMRHALERLSAWMGQAMQEGRTALQSLRASTTQRNDLAEAIRRVIEDCSAHGLMTNNFAVEGTVAEMHPIVRDEIYRIGYEAIRNAYMHSQGTRLEVQLRYGHDLYLRVQDNGVGITANILAHGREGHFGLHGMRERAARIGSKFRLTSSSHSGTRIDLTVPGNIVFQREKTFQPLFAKIKKIFGKQARNTHP